MPNAAERMCAMRQRLVAHVRDALDDVSPDLAESAIGRMTQASALVEVAAALLSDEVGPELASRLVVDLAHQGPSPRSGL